MVRSAKTRKCAPTQRRKKKLCWSQLLYFIFLFLLEGSEGRTLTALLEQGNGTNTDMLIALQYVRYTFQQLAVSFGTQPAKEAHIEFSNCFFSFYLLMLRFWKDSRVRNENVPNLYRWQYGQSAFWAQGVSWAKSRQQTWSACNKLGTVICLWQKASSSHDYTRKVK